MLKKYREYIKPVLQGCAVLFFAVLLGIWAGSDPAIPASVPEAETESGAWRPGSSRTESETQVQPAPGSSETASGSDTEAPAGSGAAAVVESDAETEAESDTDAAAESNAGAKSEEETETDSRKGTENATGNGSENTTEKDSENTTKSSSESGTETEIETEGHMDVDRLYKPGDILRTDSENPLLPYSQYKISDEQADWFIIPEDFIEAYLKKYKLITSDIKIEITEAPLSWTDLETILTYMTDRYEGRWSIYVKDLKNDRSIIINDQPMEAASLIKLYIMGAVYEQMGMNAIDDNLTISDALYNMITVSDNESANTLVRALDPDGDHSKGMVIVNNFIREYGFTNTEQVNGLADPSLWSDDGRLNQTSAKDCGMFLEYVYRGEMVSHLASREMESLLLGQEIDYKIPDSLPSEVVSASKTGEVEGCENDTAIVYSPGGDYIICIMSNGWSDDAQAVSRIHSLSEAVYAFFNPDSGYTITLPEGQLEESAPLTEYDILEETE